MTVRRIGKKWTVDFRFQHADGRVERVRKLSPVQSRSGAVEFERQLRNAMLSPARVARKEVPTLSAFVPTFMKIAEARNKPSEVASKRSVFEHHLLPAFGHRRLDEIGYAQIQDYAAALAEIRSKKTVNNTLTVLRRVLVVAKKRELIAVVPEIEWLRAPMPEFDFLSFEEAERLLEAARLEIEWFTMILTALRTGMRQGELLALRWEDVDLVAGQINVRRSVTSGVVTDPKSGRGRTIPLGDEVRAALKAHRHLRGELVFCAADGRMLGKNECKHPLWRACRRAGLRRVGWHVARHSFASHLVMRGVALKAVQELLGHATIEMTMRYSHLSPEVTRDAVKVLDRGPRGQYLGNERTGTGK